MIEPPLRAFPPGPAARTDGVIAALRYFYGFYTDPIGFVRGRFDRYGDVYYVPNAGGGLFVLRHPDHLKEVLVTRAASFGKAHSAFRHLSSFLGDGLLTTEGEIWKRQRRIVQPAFATTRLAGYARTMVEESRVTTDRFRDGATIDAGHEMMDLTLRIVARTLFGHDVAGETKSVARAMAAFQESIESVGQLLPEWIPTPNRKRSREGLATIDRIIYAMIARARGEKGDSATPNLLSILVSAVDVEGDGRGLDEREVRDQLVTLFLAGHETTSHALTWTLYLLSQNPRAQAKLFEELDRVLAGRAATYDDLPTLPYTEQVVEEAMRLYPPVYSLARAAKEDTVIGGYPVPKGSEVVLWIYMTQRDERWFEAPTEFRPERFAEPTAIPKFAYLPFGGGSRACIGKSFAMLEARLALATLLQKHRLELAPDQRVDVKPRITLCPKYGMKMLVRAR